MNKLGVSSYRRLKTVHPALRVLCLVLLGRMDITIVCGHRSKADQDQAFKDNKSKVKFPNSKHNLSPSHAVDIAPYLNEVRWNEHEVIRMMGRVEEIADHLNIPIRWGGDWDGDGDMVEHKFKDFVHIELDMKRLNETSWTYL